MIINIELDESQEYQEARRTIEAWEEKHHELMKDPDGNREELQASYENRPKEAMKKLTPPEFDNLVERATLQYIDNVAGNYKKYMDDAKKVIDAFALADFFITTGYFKQHGIPFIYGSHNTNLVTVDSPLMFAVRICF